MPFESEHGNRLVNLDVNVCRSYVRLSKVTANLLKAPTDALCYAAFSTQDRSKTKFAGEAGKTG